MLNLESTRKLADRLRAPLHQVLGILRRADAFYDELSVFDPRKPGKERTVLNPRGALRQLQARFYEDVLLQQLDRSQYSHGGVPGRSIMTNIRPHLGQAFVFTTDVSNFYPSIHRQRVFDLFTRLGCSEEVAGLCTRLCTVEHRLAQGLITSPILADQLMRPVDERIGAACHENGLVYTRFVDDIAISGPFDLCRSGFPALVHRILDENGFLANPDKDQFGRVTEGAAITGLRFPRGHADVMQAYFNEVVRQLRDATNLGQGNPFDGPYYPEYQIRGRVRFVCWVNPRHRRALMPLLARIDWGRLHAEAERQGLVACRIRLRQHAT